MTNDVTKVLQGKPAVAGGVSIGTSGATLPTDATTAATGFTALGYLSDSGVTRSTASTTDKIKAWGGDIVKVTQTEYSVTYTFTLYQFNDPNVSKAVFGDSNVTTATGTQAIKINGDTMPKLPWMFELVDGDVKVREVVPLGQVTSVGDVTYSDSDVIGYEVTVEAFADGSGNNAYVYTDDGTGA